MANGGWGTSDGINKSYSNGNAAFNIKELDGELENWWINIIGYSNSIRSRVVDNYDRSIFDVLYSLYEWGQIPMTGSQMGVNSAKSDIAARMNKNKGNISRGPQYDRVTKQRIGTDLPVIVDNAIDSIVSALWTSRPNFTIGFVSEEDVEVTQEASAALRSLKTEIGIEMMMRGVRARFTKFVRNLFIYGASVIYEEVGLGHYIPDVRDLVVEKEGDEVSFASWTEYYDIERIRQKFGDEVLSRLVENGQETASTTGQYAVKNFALGRAFRPVGYKEQQYFSCLKINDSKEPEIRTIRNCGIDSVYQGNFWSYGSKNLSTATIYTNLLAQVEDTSLPIFLRVLARGFDEAELEKMVMTTNTPNATLDITHANLQQLLIPSLNAMLSLRQQLIVELGGRIQPNETSASNTISPLRRTPHMNVLLPKVINHVFDRYLLDISRELVNNDERYTILQDYRIRSNAFLVNDQIEAQSRVQSLVALRDIAAGSGLPLDILAEVALELGINIQGDITAAREQAARQQQIQQLAQASQQGQQQQQQ